MQTACNVLLFPSAWSLCLEKRIVSDRDRKRHAGQKNATTENLIQPVGITVYDGARLQSVKFRSYRLESVKVRWRYQVLLMPTSRCETALSTPGQLVGRRTRDPPRKRRGREMGRLEGERILSHARALADCESRGREKTENREETRKINASWWHIPEGTPGTGSST